MVKRASINGFIKQNLFRMHGDTKQEIHSARQMLNEVLGIYLSFANCLIWDFSLNWLLRYYFRDILPTWLLDRLHAGLLMSNVDSHYPSKYNNDF
jgi:hypothetical protein